MALDDELNLSETDTDDMTSIDVILAERLDYTSIDAVLNELDDMTSIDAVLEELDRIEFDDMLEVELEDLPHDQPAEASEGLENVSDVLSLGFDSLPGLSIDDGEFLQAIQQVYDESDDNKGDDFEAL